MSMKALQDMRAISDFKKRANALHASFHNGSSALIELGREINAFIESGLYQTESPTVEAFFKKNFNWSESYVNRLRRAAKFASPIDLLGDATGEVAKSAMRSAKSSSKVKSSQTVRNLGSGLSSQIGGNGESPPNPIKQAKASQTVDYLSIPITEEAMPCWNRKQEVQNFLTQLEAIKATLLEAKKSGDMFYCSEIDWDEAYAALKQLYYQLSKCKPYTICLFCSGHPELTKCAHCNGRGMMSEDFYNSKDRAVVGLRATREANA